MGANRVEVRVVDNFWLGFAITAAVAIGGMMLISLSHVFLPSPASVPRAPALVLRAPTPPRIDREVFVTVCAALVTKLVRPNVSGYALVDAMVKRVASREKVSQHEALRRIIGLRDAMGGWDAVGARCGQKLNGAGG